MAKRGAEDQLTKDDVESGRGGRDDSDDENNVARDAPKEVLATRQIRGMPKRKGASGTPAPAPQAPSFGFGQSSASAAPATGFAAPASSGFSFGSSAATTTSGNSAPPKQGFSFGVVAPSKTGASTGTSGGAFSGFSFGGASAAPTTASAAAKPTSSSAFSATETSSKQPEAETPKASLNPFASFAFSPASSTPKADPPAAASSAATAGTTVSIASGAFGKASSTSTASAFGAPSAIIAAPKSVESSSSAVESPASTATSQAKTEQPREDQKEIEYLTSVRGLNESVVRALSVKIRDEPFVNLAAALDSVKAEYNTFLEEIMKKAGKDTVGKDVQTKKRAATAMDDSPMNTPPSKKVPEAPKPAFAMPAPPTSDTGGFKLPAPSAPSSSTAAANGFKPSFGATQLEARPAALPAVGGFKLPTVTPLSAETATPAAGGFKPTLPSNSAPAKASPFAGFSFGAAAPVVEKKIAEPTTTPVELASTKSSVPLPTFASATPSSSTTESSSEKRPSSRASIFAQSVIDEQAKEKAAEKEAPSTSAPGAKTSSIFAMKPTVKPAIGESMVVPSPPTSAGASSFLFKAPSTPSAAASTTPGALPKFSFNMGATSGSTATGAPGTPGTPGSPGMFSFAAKPRSTSAAFGFGTAKGDVADKSNTKDATSKTDALTTPSQPPTSAFSFGASAPRAATAQSLFSAPTAERSTDASKPMFSFGPTSTFAAPKAVEAVTDNSGPNTDSEEAPADSGPQADLTSGAGEEDEETLWQGKTSVGSFGVWGEATTPGWGNFKVCIVKLNREKNPSEGAQPMRRIIARMDPTGAVVQNFSLRSLSDMAALTETSYKLTVAGADGIQQIAVRFGKKREGFDPVPSIEKLKSVIRSEREAMGLAALPSLK